MAECNSCSFTKIKRLPNPPTHTHMHEYTTPSLLCHNFSSPQHELPPPHPHLPQSLSIDHCPHLESSQSVQIQRNRRFWSSGGGGGCAHLRERTIIQSKNETRSSSNIYNLNFMLHDRCLHFLNAAHWRCQFILSFVNSSLSLNKGNAY